MLCVCAVGGTPLAGAVRLGEWGGGGPGTASPVCGRWYGGHDLEAARRADHGVTGQDGAHLAEYLLGLGYTVHGIKRRSSSFNTARVDHLYEDRHSGNVPFLMHYGDMTGLDQPDPAGAADQATGDLQSRRPEPRRRQLREPGIHCQCPTPSACCGCWKRSRILGMEKETRFYQASTSELSMAWFRKCRRRRPRHSIRVRPMAPCFYGYWITVNHREAYGMIQPPTASCSITRARSAARPSSPARSLRGVARIETGLEETLYLGNLEAKRDWGHARDYVEGMYRILQADVPDDFVLATGETRSVREFVELASGKSAAKSNGAGRAEETGIDRKSARPSSASIPSISARPRLTC